MQPKHDLTLSDYNRLHDGMSYREACALLGQHGYERARYNIDRSAWAGTPIDFASYLWLNSDGSNINLDFKNDQLVEKRQFNLH
jgi:hypothetical protein